MRRTKMIVISDGEHARFVKLAEDNALRTEFCFDSASAHKRSSDLGSDKPGRGFESAAAGRHAVNQRHDLHELEKDKFSRYVGQRINEARASGGFDELIVVAPSRALAQIRETLQRATKDKLIGTLAKDLVKVPDHELRPHLKEWIQPIGRR